MCVCLSVSSLSEDCCFGRPSLHNGVDLQSLFLQELIAVVISKQSGFCVPTPVPEFPQTVVA